MSCTVCAHPRRSEIDAELSAPDADVLSLAQRFGVTKHAIRQHAEHASLGAAPSPPTPSHRRPERPTRPSRLDVSRGTSAEERVLHLLKLVGDLMDDIMADEEASHGDRVKAIHAASRLIDQLVRIRGEKPLDEDVIARLPAWQRIRDAIADALAPHPQAALDVEAALDRVFGAAAPRAAA